MLMLFEMNLGNSYSIINNRAVCVILGNITASTITVLDGATIQGYVNTTFLQESSSSIFPEAIALSE